MIASYNGGRQKMQYSSLMNIELLSWDKTKNKDMNKV